MSYIKAKHVFPQSLLIEIQKYVQGELVYIPKSPTNRSKWGTGTDTKRALAQRNEKIYQDFRAGASISLLAKSYNLAEETIKKIVYVKR